MTGRKRLALVGDVYRAEGAFWMVHGVRRTIAVKRIEQPGPEPVFTMSGVPVWEDGAWWDSGAAA